MFLLPLLTADDAVLVTPADTLGLAESLIASAGGLPFLEPWAVGDAPGTLSGLYAWADYIGYHLWGIVSGAAQYIGDSGASQGGRILTSAGTPDLRVGIRILEWYCPGGGLVVGPAMRFQGDTSLTFYSAVLMTLSGVTAVSLVKLLAGVQTQVGPSIPVTPHANMTLEMQGKGNRFGIYFDGQRVLAVNDTVSPILTGSFIGMQAWGSTGNRIRVSPLTAAAPTADVIADLAENPALTEAIRLALAKSLAPEEVGLTEGLTALVVKLASRGDALSAAEALSSIAAHLRHPMDTVGLAESLGIQWQTLTPIYQEGVLLGEEVRIQPTGRRFPESVALGEILGQTFKGAVRVGIIRLTNETILVSGSDDRTRVTARGLCRVTIPEQSGFEYTADLIGRGGVPVTRAELTSLAATLYNKADQAIINGVEDRNILNTDRGTLTDDGHLTVTLDAADTPMLDGAKTHEHHVLLLEGTYDGGPRVFRRAIEHVVENMAKVP